MSKKKIDGKREYKKPSIKNLGAMVRITAGSGGSVADGGSGSYRPPK